MKDYVWATRMCNPFTGKITYELNAFDEMPEGWKLAFGDLMAEDLDRAIKKAQLEDEFVVEQVKEKYGGLRFYCYPTNDDIERIIDTYSRLSEHICIKCGKPDVPMIHDGWISPWCEDCYCNSNYRTIEGYRRFASEQTRMADEVRYKLCRKGELKEVVIDLSDTAQKIRDGYENFLKSR